MRDYLRFTILFLIAVAILWFFGRDLDWQAVSEHVRQADPWYLAGAVLIISLGYLLRAIRWKVLLAPITETSLRELFATTTVGFSAIFLIGRMGEIVRPMWLPMRDKRVRPSAALVTLGLERVFDLAALVCFFSINLLWFTPQPGREDEFLLLEWAGGALIIGVIIGFIALIIFQRVSERVIGWTERFTTRAWMPKRLQAIVLSIMRQLAAALAILRDWRETVLVSFWTLALWFAISIPTWWVLMAFGLPLTFSDSLFIMGFATVSSVVPTPGGAAGAFHAATGASLLFLRNDIPTETAAAVALVMHLVYFVPALFFGLYYFLRGDISVERFRGLLSSENAQKEIKTDSPDFA